MPGGQLHQPGGLQISRQPQGIQHRLLVHLLSAAGALVQQGKGVPQAAISQPGQKGRSLRGQVDALLPRHILQALGNLSGQDAFERELLTPGADGSRHLVQLRGGQNKHQVGRRLLQDLQQRIEGWGGEHMDLVHDIDPLTDRRRGIDRLIPQGPDLVYAVVGGGIQLQHIQDRAVFNAQAGRALIAGVAVHRALAVHRPGQDLGAGGLARPPGPSEQIGVGQPPPRHLLLQSVGDMALAHHIVKSAGPPFAVQGLIHDITSNPFLCPSGQKILDAEQGRTPAFEAYTIPVTWTAGSRTVTPRHTRRAA